MFNNSNFDVFVSSLNEEFRQTPQKNSNPPRMTFFSPRTLNEGFRFSPSAWKTPERPRTGETPFRLGTPHAHEASPSHLCGTPSTYSAPISPSRTPRGMPGLYRTPIANIGVTPARIMGPFSRRDLLLEATPPSSPISMIGHRKIYTPKSLREKRAWTSLEGRDGPDLLDMSLFGMAEAPSHHPTTPFGRVSASHADPGMRPPPTSFASPIPPPSAVLSPMEAAPIQGNVGAVDGMNDDGEHDGTKEDVEDGDTEDSEDEDETEGVIHHAQTLTDYIHSQYGAQNGSTADDGNVWLPFPHGRDTLVMYLEEGLSLRHLFPSSIQGDHIQCEAELKLVEGHWIRTDMCNQSEGSAESYQRHVKSKHLGVKRSKQVGVDHIVNTVWKYGRTIPKQPTTWLRVERWDPSVLNFPLAE